MMVRVRQRRVAKLLIENETLDKPLNGGQLLAKAGYAKSMLKSKVNDVLESKGVKDALDEYGFSVDNAKKVVASILNDENNEAHARLKASDMVFKVHGTYAPEKNINVNIETEANDEVRALTEKLNAIHRSTGISSHGGSSGALGTEAQDKE